MHATCALMYLSSLLTQLIIVLVDELIDVQQIGLQKKHCFQQLHVCINRSNKVSK